MSCNCRAGAYKINDQRLGRLPVTRIVSQRLTDDPEPGTVVHLDNERADYYDGHEWRTVNRRELALPTPRDFNPRDPKLWNPRF